MRLPLEVAELIAIPALLLVVLGMARYRGWRADHLSNLGARTSPGILSWYLRMAVPLAIGGAALAIIALVVALINGRQ